MKLLEIKNCGHLIFEILEVSQEEIDDKLFYIFKNQKDLDTHIEDLIPLRHFGYLKYYRKYIVK